MDEFIDVNYCSTEIDVLDSAIYNYDNANLSLTFYEKSQNILLRRVRKLIEKSPAFFNFLENTHPQEFFNVNMSKSAREMYEKGEWLLKYSKTKNGFLPMLCDQTGKYKEQVTLNIRNISPNLSSALTILSMQNQLQQLMDQLTIMNNTINRIERGQIDDRIALFYSARQQYIEAVSMSNAELQEQALLYAARTANNSRFSMIQTMKSEIGQVLYGKLRKNEKDKLSNSIREAMQYINESTGLCIMCFSALGETKSLLATVKSYQCFIEQVLLAKDDNSGLTKAQMLHQNWPGHDDEWLDIPQKIVKRLNQIITDKSMNPILIESSGE